MTDAPAPTWRFSASLSPTLLPAVEEGLLALGGAVVVGAKAIDGSLSLEAHFAARPEEAALRALLTGIAEALGEPLPSFALEALAARDWVAESQAALPAERIGRFYLYGAHNCETPPRGFHALRIEAATAFGTGRHGSTAGCLTALTRLGKRVRPRRVLDLGCGTAVLAMAAAKLWPCRVLAVDNDAGSIPVARENLRANGLSARVGVLLGDGLTAARVRGAGPYDLVLANILAGPLQAMARDLARAVAPGGTLILAGLLGQQERLLVARYRAAGLALAATLRFGEWSTLILVRK